MPLHLNVLKDGIKITFTNALDAASAVDEQNWAIDQWNYQWTSSYGSKMYSAKDPAREVGDKKQGDFGGDPVPIKGVKLLDKMTVYLELENLKPVMQSRIRFNIRAEDNTVIKQEIFHTILLLKMFMKKENN